MSLNSIISTAVSGLQTAQSGINTVSNNVANINTPGYQREVLSQTNLVAGGAGEGVTAGEIQRVTDQYLEGASLQASAASGSASIISNLMDQAQSAFGDPTSSSSYLNQLSTVFSDFAAAANNPSSSLPRSQTLSDLNTFLDTTQQVAGSLSGLSAQANGRISDDVTQVNQLLSQISGLNSEISTALASGSDATGAENSQSQLINTLSSLIGVKVTTQANGAAVVRSNDGALLAGFGGSATLTYTPSGSAQGTLSITQAGTSTATPFTADSGELQGLLSLTNTQIPAIQAQLSNYVSGAVTAINAAHNANTAAPPPQTLTGRNTGLDLPTIVGDFSGTTNIAVLDSTGAVTQQVQINFSTGAMTVNGAAGPSFTPSTFLSSLNTALGGAATASFSNGALSLSATASGSGVAIADDAATPAQDGGQGFSQFFGLNDLITSSGFTNYNTGLQAGDANGFNAGGSITLQIADQTGAPVTNVTVAVPAGGTMQDLVNALNAPVGGVGLYGAFSLNASGALTFSPTTPGGASIAVASDSTQRGANGPSMSALFGIGVAAQAGRATTYQIRSDIAGNPANLALGTLDLAAAAGEPAVSVGDGSGAIALAAVANANTQFGAAGNLATISTSVSQYGALLGGDLGQRATSADSANTAAAAVQSETSTRLQGATGVNLDQELVNLTTYQQAYAASAQLINASKSMYATLLNMMG